MGELRLDVNKRGARRGGVTSFAVPEHHRDGPVNPMLAQIGNLGLEICSSGRGREEGVR
jgi:hypothetical protein